MAAAAAATTTTSAQFDRGQIFAGESEDKTNTHLHAPLSSAASVNKRPAVIPRAQGLILFRPVSGNACHLSWAFELN
jgi:hypothetical protein